MAAPYASVILPTFNRDSTLPYALASVQAQSESALEIIVVLDGASEVCRQIGYSAAAKDRRIQILDLPKAPGSGGGNIDLAVKRAAGPRIFYIDDDDLWLPNHVAELGQFLNEADLADSRVCSADRSGRLNLVPCRPSNGRMRTLLGEFTHKALYDTHIAHRREAYGKYSRWVPPNGESSRPVWDFLAGFASNPACFWASHDAVTAISLHGAARRDMKGPARAKEISLWARKIDDPTAWLSALDDASCLFHLFRLLHTDPPNEGALEDYLNYRGGYEWSEPAYFERQLFALALGRAILEDEALEIAHQLAEPVESGYIFQAVADTYSRAFSPGKAADIFRQLAHQNGGNLACRLAMYSAALWRSDIRKALEVIRLAADAGPDPGGALGQWKQTLEWRLNSGR